MFDRRGLLQLTAVVATSGLMPPRHSHAASESAGASATSAGASASAAATISSAQAQTIWARLNGDLSGRTVYFTTLGDVWGFLPQADDLELDAFARRAYGYAGVAARKMHRRADGAIVVRQKSWAFYRDPDSEQLSEKIPNRWTGAVDTAPPLSGPTSEQVLSPRPVPASPDPYHMHIRTIGGRAFVSTSGMARFRARDTTWFKLEGNLASHHCGARDLDDAALTHVPGTYCQNLIAEWQTWTGMHGRPGHILFKGDGVPLLEAAQIPYELQRAIQSFFPGQLNEVGAWR